MLVMKVVEVELTLKMEEGMKEEAIFRT